MNERIDAFLKDVLETRRRVVNAIRDGIRSYVAVYENLVRDPEQDKTRGGVGPGSSVAAKRRAGSSPPVLAQRRECPNSATIRRS